MVDTYWLAVRLFHITLGLVLAVAGYKVVNGDRLPKSFYQLLIVLGAAAVAYHSYRLAQLYGYLN